jgi:hypothetical protein
LYRAQQLCALSGVHESRVCPNEQSLPGRTAPEKITPGNVAGTLRKVDLKPGAKEGRLVPFQPI